MVNPEDTLWILGDVGFFKTIPRMEELVRRLNGRKIIILGNHDNSEHYHQRSWDKTGIVGVYWRMVESTNKEFGGFHPTLSHFPLLSWDRSFHGSFNLHGHEHGNIPFNPKVRRLDVGVDCNKFTPVSWEAVAKKLGKIPTPKEQSSTGSRGGYDPTAV